MILLDTTQKDKDALEQFCNDNAIQMPNVKMSVYKNRRGSFTRGYLWMRADKGTCRYDPIFATTWDYEFVPINDFDIETQQVIEVDAVCEEATPLITMANEDRELLEFDMFLDGNKDWKEVF